MPSGTWALGWVTGDVVTAAEYRKGVGALYDTTLGAAAASIDVTGIVASYAHLRVLVYARGDTAALSTGILLRINNDSTASYQTQQVYGGATTPSAAEGLAQTSISLGSMPAATAPANWFGASEIVIPHYAGSTNQKAVEASTGYRVGTGTGQGISMRSSGWWSSGGAINRLTLLPAAGNFAAGTRVTIYGMGA